MDERQLKALRESVAAEQDALDKRAQKMLDDVTVQAICLILLKHHRSKGTIKPAALNEIRYAREQFLKGEYDPQTQLQRILEETTMDREAKRETPR